MASRGHSPRQAPSPSQRLLADNTALPRPIEVGPTAGNLTIVTSGLRDGEAVVTDGQYKLQPNAPVTVTSPPTAVSEKSS